MKNSERTVLSPPDFCPDHCYPKGSLFSARLYYRSSENKLEKETIASLPGLGMAPEGQLSYSSGPNMRARRTQPCLVQVRIDPIPPKGLLRLQTCHRQRSSHTVASTHDKGARIVVTRPIGTSSFGGHCTTWGISTCGVRVISWSRIRSTTVQSVARTLARTSPIWRHRAVSTRTA